MGKGKGSGWGSGWGFGTGSGDYNGKTERMWMPALPIPLAILCCVLNFLIPGLGTLIAGLCVFCCARTEDMDASSKGVSCIINWGIGLAQMASALIMFLGWIWSCYWGVAFIMSSADYYHDNNVDDHDRGAAVTTTVSTTQFVYNNGSGNPSAIIIQPTHFPFQIVQSGARSGPNVTTQQPIQPPPYPGTGVSGINPSGFGNLDLSPIQPPPYPGTGVSGINPSGFGYPDPPLIKNADSNEQKIGL